MKFSVKSSDLQKSLSKIIGVVPTRSTLPILENILFDVNKNILKITATDLELSVTVSVDIKGIQDGIIAIPAKRLADTIKALPETLVTFSVDTDNNKIKMKTENGEYALTGESSDEFPSAPQFKSNNEIVLEPDVLQRLISKTLFAVSTDELRPSMMGILLQFDTSDVKAVATDGHRLVRISNSSSTSSTFKKDIVIPAKALGLVEKLSTNESGNISINESHIMFSFGNTSLISRLIEDKYPNYETVIPLDNEKKLIVNKEELFHSVRRVSLYSSSATHQIRFSLKKNELSLTAEDVDFGSEAHETIVCDYTSEEMEIGFNSAYVLDILAHLEYDEIVFNLSTPTRAAIIHPAHQKENEDLLMLVMPVRLNN